MKSYDQIAWATLFHGMGVGHAQIDAWATPFSQVIDKNTFDGGDEELAQYMGQIVHESTMMSALSENLNYTPAGLTATFGIHRISQAQADTLGRTPAHPADQKAIAMQVYGGQWGLAELGNLIGSEDGWNYRGSGLIQTTGRYNFLKAEKATDIPFTTNSELLRTPGTPCLEASLAWWRANITMEMLTDDLVLRQKVNGAKALGLDHTRALTTLARETLVSL